MREQRLTKPTRGEFRDQFRALAGAAMTHFEAGRLADAESAYRAALALAPADPLVTHNLGVVIAALGRHRAALGCFDEALTADPGFVSAHYNSGVALMELGETDIDRSSGGISRAHRRGHDAF